MNHVFSFSLIRSARTSLRSAIWNLWNALIGIAGFPWYVPFGFSKLAETPDFAAILDPFAILRCPPIPTCPPIKQCESIVVEPAIPVLRINTGATVSVINFSQANGVVSLLAKMLIHR